MEVIDRKVSELIPYANNPRHNDGAVDTVAASIKNFGFKVPIIVDKDGVIVAGHTRLKAAQKLGLKTVPCIVADDLTPEQIKAFRLADNKVGELAEWDFEKLDLELEEIDLDMTQFGFDDLPEEETESTGDEDNALEPPEDDNTVTKKGDVWLLGRHRLMCGDSTDKNDVSLLMKGATADLLLTDPPYGVSIVKGSGKIGGDKPPTFKKDKGSAGFATMRPAGENRIVAATEYAPIIGDESTDTARESYEIARGITDVQVIFGGNYFTDFLPPSRCWFVWDKGMPDGTPFAQCELAWVSKDGNAKLFKRLWAGLCREGARSVEGVKRIHPTQKPVSLCEDILGQFKDCKTVLDLFGGSGSTLIACERTGRECFMMELSPQYCDVIIQRWQDLTGKEATLERTGETFDSLKA